MSNHETIMQMKDSKEIAFASPLKRLISSLIDAAILIFVVLAYAVIITLYSSSSVVVHFTLILSIVLFYFPVLEGSRLHASIGKLMMGLRVADGEGNPVKLLQASGRGLIRCGFYTVLPGVVTIEYYEWAFVHPLVYLAFSIILLVFMLLIGMLIMIITERNVGFHDIFSNTIVKCR